MNYNIHYSDELQHHGVKGQRWGERNYQYEDGSLTPEGKARYASNYKPSQRAQDEVHYGRGGMERINRNMRDRGYNVSTARSVEAQRINNARKRAGSMRSVGRVAGTVGGLVAGYKLSSKILQATGLGNNIIANIAISSVVVQGSVSVGKSIGEYGGQAIGMLSSGYSPDKYRYAN